MIGLERRKMVMERQSIVVEVGCLYINVARQPRHLDSSFSRPRGLERRLLFRDRPHMRRLPDVNPLDGH